MKTILNILFLAVVVGVLTGCTSNDFTIQAQLDGVSERTVIIAYSGDHGVVTDRVKLEEGNSFTYRGNSDQYTLVSLWDLQGQLIAQLVAHNGDKMVVKSDGLQLPTTQVSGNEVTEQWMKFRKDNHLAYDSHDTTAIDRLIEQQISKHPDQLLSTVLLVADYSQLDGGKHTRQLLQSIHAEARPQRLVSSLEYLMERHQDMPERVTTLTLYRLGKGFEDLKVNEQATILLFWSRNDEARKACVESMRAKSRQSGGKIQLADILVDPDTTLWSKTVGNDSATWAHWWAPGGVMDPMLGGIPISRTPLFIVTDSTGRVTHSGQNLQ
ncbi:MAG: hypothetical protein IKS64_00340 [Muribaculaceae bacterium]|nr:hypothetical protein [Muribaculaceae bacterium]MBR6431284.1 hypothetical protein [Muribaculaceae bacterium]